MNTIIQQINVEDFENNELKEAAQILQDGGLVAFPTETVYGLGANGLDENASKKIYEAKGRPSDNPLILHIADISSLEVLTSRIPEAARKLAETFWPGPLTMIFPKSDIVPYGTTGGLDTVAIRMPDHKLAAALIRTSGVPIAAPSANTSGRPSPTLAKHVADDLAGKIDMILDGGSVEIGIESTIVDVSGEVPVILRPGYITKGMLEDVVGQVEVDKAVLTRKVDTSIKPKAPGMKYKHYAPKGSMTIFEGDLDKVVTTINEQVKKQKEAGNKVGVIATEETKDRYHCDIVKCIGSRHNEISITQGLFKVLREFDDLGTEYIYTESFDDQKLGQAIMNRLLKAAGYHVVKL
ncbi:TsaC protein [Lachnospiraceae bacterium KM106-2]|nr:TsaC protein [Lachnospiraceae bacterium KM106-2]